MSTPNRQPPIPPRSTSVAPRPLSPNPHTQPLPMPQTPQQTSTQPINSPLSPALPPPPPPPTGVPPLSLQNQSGQYSTSSSQINTNFNTNYHQQQSSSRPSSFQPGSSYIPQYPPSQQNNNQQHPSSLSNHSPLHGHQEHHLNTNNTNHNSHFNQPSPMQQNQPQQQSQSFFLDDRDGSDDSDHNPEGYDTQSFKLSQQQQQQQQQKENGRNAHIHNGINLPTQPNFDRRPTSNQPPSILDSSLYSTPINNNNNNNNNTTSTSFSLNQPMASFSSTSQNSFALNQQLTSFSTQSTTGLLQNNDLSQLALKPLYLRKPYGTVGLKPELYPDSPDHIKMLNLIRTRSMSLYNAVYKINKTFTNVPTPSQFIYNKLVSQTQLITTTLDRFDKNNKTDAKMLHLQEQQQQQQQQQQTQSPPVPISQGLKQYPDILASCLDNQELANTIVMLLNSIFDLQRAHTTDFDGASSAEAAYAYHHQKLEFLQQQEEDSRRKAVTLTKDYLAVKTKDDHKKNEKAAMLAYSAIRTYENDRRESCYQIFHTDLQSTGTILKPLQLRLQSYYEYYQKGVELMKPFEPIIKLLQQRCNELDEQVSNQMMEFAREQEEMERQIKTHLAKLGLLDQINASQQATLLTESGLTTTGIRDLDNRKANRDIGNTKRGFLFTPPPNATRVWVELKDKTLKISEEVNQYHQSAKTTTESSTPQPSAGSRFQNLLDKVTQENKASSTPQQPQSASSDDKSSSSSSTSYKVIFETSTMLLTAKASRDSKYRYVFQVIGPNGSSFLQAESESIMNDWLDCIQNAIGNDLTLEQSTADSSTREFRSQFNNNNNNTSSPTSPTTNQLSSSNNTNNNTQYNPAEVLEKLQSIPGNMKCCDCGADNPDWISINLGVLICLDCSGAHRQLGVSISKVRSIMMDKLDPHIINYCMAAGNTLVNHILLEFYQHDQTTAQRSGITDPILNITPNSPRGEKAEHIKCKYQDRRWVLQDILLTSKTRLSLTPQQIEERAIRLSTLLYNGIRQGSISNVFRACISGVDPTRFVPTESVPPLFEGILYGCPTFLTCMLQFTENVNFKEDRGWNCLHYAAYVNSLEMCEIVLAFCGTELSTAVDAEGKTPRQVAEFFNSEDQQFQQELPAIMALLTSAEQKYLQRQKKNY